MAFNDEVLKDGRGRVLRIDASVDGFSTVSYRWGNVAGVLDGTNQYSSRIISIAPVWRGLGQNRIAGGGTCEVVLANADGVLDALAGRANISTQAKLRLRIYVCLYTLGASPLAFTSKLLGEFTLTEWIRQDNETLRLALGDDVMTSVAQQASLPTLLDWAAVGNATNNPIYNAMGIPDSISDQTPIQLAFGENWILALPHIIPWVNDNYEDHVIVPVCCTTDTGAVSQDLVSAVRVQWRAYTDVADFTVNRGEEGFKLRDIPRTVIARPAFGTSAAVIETLWTVEKSPSITKDGKTFQVVYLKVKNSLGIAWSAGTNWDDTYLAQYKEMGNYPAGAIEWAGPEYRVTVCRVVDWYIKGSPLSARTQTTVPIQHPVDVLTDLVSHYSDNTAITINTAAGARAKLSTRSAACSGVVQSWLNGPRKGDTSFRPSPSLRQTITAICQSSDIDCFIDWDGKFSFAGDFWDFRIAATGWTADGGTQTSGDGISTPYIPATIPESWLADGVERWIPSDGERWAPYNRLWMDGGTSSPADGVDAAPYQGPWDFDSGQPGSITLADRIVEATLEQGWRPYRQQALAPWYWRQVNIVARDMVRFRTHIGGLQLELGQYFALSWTRGSTLGGPYSGTIFQCEAITYSPGDDTVEVTAVWRDDVMSERQYILDDETMIVRSKGALTGSATTASPTAVVSFGGTINLTTMGVVAGDILVLRDTAEAADSFAVNLALRILSVDSTTAVTVEANLAASATIVNADWAIQRGATTYHTAVSDVTNYPLGGDQYGKVTDSGGLYSNAATGNRLISG